MTLVMAVALTLLAVMIYHWIFYTVSPVSQLSPRVYFPVMCGLLAMNAIFVCLLSYSLKRKDVDLQSDTVTQELRNDRKRTQNITKLL